MKIIVIGFFYFVLASVAFAQADSSAYLTQRNKINQLLSERSNNFGQYKSSLEKRSGIFGLKTKKDMQSSNDILRQIVITDNHIFSELKILLDYKDFEKTEAESRAQSVEGYIKNYRITITRLQKENERLKTIEEQTSNDKDQLLIYMIVLITILALSIFYVFKLKKLRRTDI